jgi:hypothetical protein
MSTLSYEAEHRRLRVAGPCGNEDAPRLHEAVLTFARQGGTLVRKSGSPVDSVLRETQPAVRSGSRRAMTGVDSTPCTRTEATMVKDTVDHSQSAPSSGASPAAYAR